MAGLLDFINTPAGQGLLSGIASYAMNAQRGTPVNNIGRGLAGGLAGYTGAKEQISKDSENALTRQYKKLQMDEIARKLAEQKAQQEWKAGLPQIMDQAKTKPFEADNAFGEDLGNLVQQGDPQAVQEYMMRPESPYADDLIKQQIIPDKPQLVTVYEDGRPMQKWVRPGESGGVTVGMGKTDSSALGKLIAERDSLPEGHPARAMYNQAIQKSATHAPASQLNNYGSPVAGVGPDGQPVFFQPSKGGGAPTIVPGITPTPPKPTPPTGEENTAAGYLGRMKAAEKLIGGLTGGEPTVGTSIAGSVPFIGDYVQRKAMNATQQQYKQASDDWIRAKLRKESGAVIADAEMLREYQTYFPQPGDEPTTIKQKAMARRQAEEQMIQSAGRAAPKQTEVPFTKAETDYIAKRRAAGVPDQEIALELQQGAAKPKQATFDLPPNAKQYEGKTLRDTKSGKRFKSIGGKWVQVK